MERLQAKNNLEGEKKRITSGLTTQIKEVVKEIDVLRSTLATGKEIREVETEERLNIGEGRVDVFRKDTGERVDTRALTENDRQSSLPFDGSASHPQEEAEELDEPEEEGETISREEEPKEEPQEEPQEEPKTVKRGGSKRASPKTKRKAGKR